MSNQGTPTDAAGIPTGAQDGPLLLPLSEAARMLGVSKMTVRRRIKSSVWPSGRCGTKHLLPRAFVEGAVAAVGRGIDIEAFAKTWFEQTAEEMAS